MTRKSRAPSGVDLVRYGVSTSRNAALLQHPADGGVGPGPDLQAAPGRGAAQVEVAVLEAQGLVGVGAALQRERRGLGGGQHLDVGGGHLDLAGGQLGVLVAGRAGPDRARDPDAVLGPDGGRGRRLVGADDHLHDPGGVAQVEEGDPAVVAPAGHPAGQPDLGPGVAGPQAPAGVGAHGAEQGTGHGAPPPATRRTWSTTWSRGTGRWSRAVMSRTAAWPAASSCSPRMTTVRAPALAAAFMWPLRVRSA